jgi:hypothetical protein
MQIAVVATARKLACLCWHMISKGEDYAHRRPSLTTKKLRALELRAGMPARRGRKGNAAPYVNDRRNSPGVIMGIPQAGVCQINGGFGLV